MHVVRKLMHGRVSGSTRSTLECWEAFKQLFAEQSNCKVTYHGWPPASRIPIANGTFRPLERGIFVMNRTLKDGMRTEPTLVITCGSKPMLMFNRSEFEALVERLPWIKDQMKEFYKLI